jgi:hypothetical protein
MNFRLSMPIFVHPSTGQTIIASLRGSNEYLDFENLSQWNISCMVYVIPPLINVYGRVISVGELIVSGYASFINTGITMTTIADFTNFFHLGPRKWSSHKTCLKYFLLLDAIRFFHRNFLERLQMTDMPSTDQKMIIIVGHYPVPVTIIMKNDHDHSPMVMLYYLQMVYLRLWVSA